MKNILERGMFLFVPAIIHIIRICSRKKTNTKMSYSMVLIFDQMSLPVDEL